MRRLLGILLCLAPLWATPHEQLAQKLSEGAYEEACIIGKQIVGANERDEKVLSLIGMACMKADYIDALSVIQSRLYATSEARSNATLFAALLLQKRLIYEFIYDGVDLSVFSLPVSDHPLSVAFRSLRDGRYKVLGGNAKQITFAEKGLHYLLYIDDAKKGKIAIDVIHADGSVDQHRYR
ncbi:MAG: hypothetical protein JXK05_06710 [Campylobacterales bacterium]|nr:hypothetical protein [Campylobacterales bacterium]